MPGAWRILDNDIVKIHELTPAGGKGTLLATLFWGDSVRVVGRRGGQDVVSLSRRVWDERLGKYVSVVSRGLLPKGTRFRTDRLLKVRFLDVGQGDSAIVQSPAGRMVLIDGGEEEHLRRYLTTAFAYLIGRKPLELDAIVVTHGDADHYAGLSELVSARARAAVPLVSAKAVFHNGLVKAPSKGRTDRQMFGTWTSVQGKTYATQLEDDLLAVPDSRMNSPFLAWKRALAELKRRNRSMRIRRLEYGSHGVFPDLESEGIRIQVLGPIVEQVRQRAALPFLHAPGSRRLSASHTINGHSVILRMTFGNVCFLFGADLNEESEERLVSRAAADGISLRAEILKVPHHGSADFSPRVLEAVSPVVSIVSSGDESGGKEYIHPRAGLVGALGKYSRGHVQSPLIYVTEMVAFFERLGPVTTIGKKRAAGATRFPNGYNKKTFGIVHVRTDGQRVLVATHSGRDDKKESYAFQVSDRGEVRFDPQTDTR